MSFLTRSKKSEETASDVRKRYDSRIERFLDKIDSKSSNRVFSRRQSPLDTFIEWAENTLGETQKLRHEFGKQGKALQNAEATVDRLSLQLAEKSSQLDQSLAENKSLVSQHDRRIVSITQKHETLVKNIREDHDKEVKKLIGQILGDKRENSGWADDKLKINFKELQRLVDSITSPHNRELQISQNQQITQHLDPTRFFNRQGKLHFLLKSAIWSILEEQFFSAPFGFGVLGPGTGRTELMEIYLTWRKLFEGNTRTNYRKEDFSVFCYDKIANNWRSATFQSINKVLVENDENSAGTQSVLSRLSADNLGLTVDRITGLLSEIAGIANTSLSSETAKNIHRMTDLALTISLQFGINYAQLTLLVPRRGDQVQIGKEYHDCEDGQIYDGETFRVDLVTLPGIQKIGTGKSDTGSKRTVVPCEIYPDRSSS